MREIIFRGKRIDNGAWETGSLVIVRGGTADEQVFIADKMTGYNTQVIPETVGQYTGLTSKNGEKIFEGDIIKIGNKIRYVFFGICGYRHTNYGEHATDLKVEDGSKCEVIGNIHDNPELLKGRCR